MIVLGLLAAGPLPAARAEEFPRVFVLDPELLARTRRRLAAGERQLAPAL